MEKGFTHFDQNGNAVMVDVSGKQVTYRTMGHPLPIQKCSIDYELDQQKNRIHVFCTVKTEGKTGVEMEALTGVQVTLLTIYDMCKAIDKHMVMSEIHLIEKTGGKSGDFRFENR